MSNLKYYRVPDILDIMYQDIMSGIYFSNQYRNVSNRILISKCNIACDLLLKTVLTEDEIFKELDFPDKNSFKNSFRNFLGISPLEFRKRFGS
ncbi:hypothetical protein EW093_14070 [Thiospirochaeta perfilievii]|uniref:HTH araC/xylS-type domain-containing protein n=1 Tax=Thiospirochaeta perfilievii TaxID=252967 RepID=A0A5C1QFF0_9SPIO|nr:hypothetical protein [Thiospirochaeta perfilievii]QEN05779.1 hypothetical protein EW093_14070 [Thiospirochaeta perfilievii]